jgi:hypothetical protein
MGKWIENQISILKPNDIDQCNTYQQKQNSLMGMGQSH